MSSVKAAAIFSTPTGPPPYCVLTISKYRLSASDKPISSTPSISKASFTSFKVTNPSLLTWAKSRTRRKSLLATRGVPRLLLAISPAASLSILTFNTSAVLSTISLNSLSS